jgi:squalene cyclase
MVWLHKPTGAATRDCGAWRICQIYGPSYAVYAGAIGDVTDEFLFIFQKGIGAAIE